MCRFTQPKFNLLREENEGYAKLVTLLLSDFTAFGAAASASASSSSSSSSSATATTPTANHIDPVLVRDLIGSFYLDPNRVLDLVLEALEYRFALATESASVHEQHRLIDAFLPLIQMLHPSGVAQLLGFRYQMYQVCGSAAE